MQYTCQLNWQRSLSLYPAAQTAAGAGACQAACQTTPPSPEGKPVVSVSVTILTKNRADRLNEAIESVYAQSVCPLEVVVVNDGATDHTDEVVKAWQEKGYRLLYLKHTESIGITLSRKEALENSQGDFIAVLDDDDVWSDPDKLKKQLACFEADPKLVLLGGMDKPKPGHTAHRISLLGHWFERFTRYLCQYEWYIRLGFLIRNPFINSTTLFKRDVALAVGGYYHRMPGVDRSQDYCLFLRLGTQGKIRIQPEYYTYFDYKMYKDKHHIQLLNKRLLYIKDHWHNYPNPWLAWLLVKGALWLYNIRQKKATHE